MANLTGNSLFTGAISGLNSNYLLLLDGNKSLTLENILNPKNENVKNSVSQSFRSYLMSNFDSIDVDGDGKISSKDIDNYTAKLQNQGMTYNELSQLCSNGSSMSSLLDTVLSNFNEIDANHDGRVTQSEINAYRINQDIKEVKDKFPKVDPTQMSMFVDTTVSNDTTTKDKQNKVIS